MQKVPDICQHGLILKYVHLSPPRFPFMISDMWTFSAPSARDCLAYSDHEVLSESGSITHLDYATSLFDGRLTRFL